MSAYPMVFVVADKPQALLELAAGAVTLSDTVEAIWPGSAGEAGPLFGLGVKKANVIQPQDGQIFENYSKTIAELIRKHSPALVLLPADKRGKAMAARLGAALDAAVVNDVSAFGADGSLERMMYGGLAQGVLKPKTPIVIATVAPGTFESKEAGEGKGEVVEITFQEPEHPIKLRETRKREASSVNIGKARKLVGVGRGFAKKEDLSLARQLADLLGAELACSRPIAEGERWMEKERYIGVSGVMVKPDVYVATGISGQIQHMVGARDAKTIIVINKDKNAPIFKFADYGIIGDLYKVLPAMIKALS